jgi:uncharacterized membrane protein
MIRRDALSEYVRGSLWVLPTLSVLVALAAVSLFVTGQHRPALAAGIPGDF